MIVHQVEFLLEGYLLPLTMETLRVSDKLILEKVLRMGSESRLSHETADYAIAYVGTATPKETFFFSIARDYLEFFLRIYSLVSGQAVTAITGIGIPLVDMNSLGTKSVGWPSFQKIHVLHEGKSDFFNKPILEAKKRFLLLLSDRQRIMGEPLGLALTYYYFAVLASKRRLEEAVINLMIAGEALLVRKNEKKGKNLSRRLSALIAENDVERTEISKKMLCLWDLRSDIVHARRKKPPLRDVKTLFNYVRRAVERGLSLRDLSKKELVAKLDRP